MTPGNKKRHRWERDRKEGVMVGNNVNTERSHAENGGIRSTAVKRTGQSRNDREGRWERWVQIFQF